ncbi:hypothetical protein TMatcc_000479 [Talaromyces marneffei ATCC 18224]
MVTYTGSCHCGAVKYKFEMSPPIEEQKIISCNCSYCTATGRLLAQVPNTDFTYIEGKENLFAYHWGSKSVTTFSCKTCGLHVTAESRVEDFIFGQVVINVRSVHGIDLGALKLHKFNGKDFNLPPYVEKD